MLRGRNRQILELTETSTNHNYSVSTHKILDIWYTPFLYGHTMSSQRVGGQFMNCFYFFIVFCKNLAINLSHSLNLQQFAFKSATNKNIKPIAGLCPATLFVVGLINNCCNCHRWRSRNQIQGHFFHKALSTDDIECLLRSQAVTKPNSFSRWSWF